MTTQKKPFEPYYTCHACGYDMHDRAKGDPCPECRTDLDIRIDDPVAAHKSRVGLWFMIVAIIFMPVIGLISMLLVGIAQYQYLQCHSLTKIYRASYPTRQRRKLVRRLLYLWTAEIAVIMAISHYWPQTFNWW